MPGPDVADYRYSIHDASTGLMLCEAPFSGVTFSRVLSGVGTFTGTMPLWQPDATVANLGIDPANADREVVVWRDDVAIWNGPITSVDPDITSDTFTVTAREAVWYYTKRTLEVNKSYDGTDVLDVARDLDSYARTKTDATLGGIVAALPRWHISSATAGVNYSDTSPPTFYGSARHTIMECWQAIAADPSTGFEWRLDVMTGSSKQSVSRTVTLGYPSLGSTLGYTLDEGMLLGYGRTTDAERGGTRFHTRYSGGVKTLQSSAAVTAGVLLTEVVADYTRTKKDSTVTAFTKDLRRLARQPVRTVSAVVVPSAHGVPWGFCDLGDTIPFHLSSPSPLALTDSRRVIQIDYTPDSGEAAEAMALTLNVTLSDLSV